MLTVSSTCQVKCPAASSSGWQSLGRLILADEPTGNLDSASGAQILAILKQLNQEGRTVILITHDDSIARSAQRIIRIQDGKIAKNCALAFIDNSPDYAIMDAGFEKAKTLP